MIVFKNISYKVKNKIILDNISFHIKANEKVLLYGKSGSGKTTIFNLICKYIKPSKGNIYVNDIDLKTLNYNRLNKYRRQTISYILQIDDLFEDLSVIENLKIYYDEANIVKALKRLNLYHIKDQNVSILSGGERQKIAIIKEMLSDNDILLCDEITSALDNKSANEIIDFILDNFKDKTILFISHDVTMFSNKVDRLIHIENKTIDKNISINKTYKTNKNKKTVIKKRSNSFYKMHKNFSFSFFIIYLILIICFYVSFSFNDIFNHFAKLSYSKYFNYDVLSIKDNTNLSEDNMFIFKDYSDYLSSCEIRINGIKTNYNILPFNNKNNYTSIVINSLVLDRLNIENIYKLTLKNNDLMLAFDYIDVVYENNTFSYPTIYYDFNFFNDLIDINTEKLIFISEDFDFDNRFTNNPLFIEKKEDKPYLDSNAYQDYLTYQMIFDSIKQIVDYYFLIILFYSFIISIIINMTLLIKDIKRISIYIAKGFHFINILNKYIFPLIIYTILLLFICLFIKQLFKPIIIAFIIQLLSIFISYYFISKKPLYLNLKQEYLS